MTVTMVGACGTSGDPTVGQADSVIAGDAAGVDGGATIDGSVLADPADTGVASDTPDTPEPTLDSTLQDTTEDAAEPGSDLLEDIQVGPLPGATGSPCEENVDCFSGLCLPSAAGEVCAETCESSCPEGFTCSSLQAAGGDPVFVCMDRSVHLCQPCQAHTDCQLFSGVPGARCVDLGPQEGSFCGLPCDSAEDCPGGVQGGAYACVAVLGEGQCLPTSGTCDCNTWGVQSAATTTCGEDACVGTRSCGADGLSACSAPPATDEQCNDIDDDCDGVVDNGFLTDGLYLHAEHCGACGDGCADAVAHASAACGVVDGLPTCVVESCDPGFEKASPTTCVPSPESHCAPCSLDADCPAWLQCTGMGAGAFCLLGCTADGDCADGFVCAGLPGTGELACLPVGGACAGPGSPCLVDGHCEDLDACTVDACLDDDTCAYSPTHCDDGDVCTLDLCDEATGCSSSAVDDGVACDDGEVCTVGDICVSGGCNAGEWLDCDDGLFCTVDACVVDEAAQTVCDNAVVAGLCVIDGACQPDGTGHPTDPCLVCDAGTDQLAWSPRPDGTSCDDLAYCTIGDACLAGQCTPDGPRDCSFLDSACAAGVCNESLETCVPQSVEDGTSCDADGNPCTVDDACTEGDCSIGVELDCDDELTCTVDACEVDPASGQPGCVHTPVAGACVIDGACVAEGASLPEQPCLVCATVLDPWGWSVGPDGVACDDGAFCTVGDTCMAGGCEPGGPRDCSEEDTQCQTGVCDDDTDACVPEPVEAGLSCNADDNGCTVGDACAGGVCLPGAGANCSDEVACTDDVCTPDGATAFSCSHPVSAGACLIGGTCYTAFEDHPDDTCLGCFPATASDGWSPQADGLLCDDGNPCSDNDACLGGVCVGVSDSDCSPDELDVETEACGLCGTWQRSRVCSGTCDWGAWGDWTECSDEGSCEAGTTQAEDEECGACGVRTRYRACSAACEWEPWSPFGGCTDEKTCAAGTTETGTQGCGACGTQATIRVCSDSCDWGPFEPNGSCQAEGICTPNDTQSSSEPCGLCGTQALQRTCNAECGWSDWQPVGGCTDPGVCNPGDTQDDQQTCGNCGAQTRERTCSGSCQWGDWSDWTGCAGSGPCSNGQQESESCGNCGSRSRTCDGACQWGNWSSCNDPCPDTHLVWRFYWGSGNDADHMFSTSNNPPSPYWSEGAAFSLYDTPGTGLVALYQSYNASNTDHLQGINASEGQPGYCCHASLGYCSTSQTAHASKPLYRLFNPSNSDHFVTTNAGEAGGGYANEGIFCWVP